MTRAEFINNVTTWDELIEFCDDNGCDICEDVYDEEQKDDYINSNLSDIADDAGDWQELKDILSNLPTDAGYYLCNGWTDWVWLDDLGDFDEYKDDVLDWADDNDMWDWEDEDEDYDGEDFYDAAPADDEEPLYEENVDPYDLVPLEDEDISVTDLFSACGSSLKTFKKANVKAEKDNEKAFEKFVSGLSPVKSAKGD